MYGVIMFLMSLLMLVSIEWKIVFIATIMRFVGQYSTFSIGFEQSLNSLSLLKRINLKSIIDSVMTPIITVSFSLILLMFTTVESLYFLNIILLSIAILIIYISYKFQTIYTLYHIRTMESKDEDECIQSIHALASSTHNSPDENVSKEFLKLMDSNLNNYLKANIITAIGESRDPELEQVLYKQMENESELIQTETIKAIGKYETYTSLEFLFYKVLFGEYRLSNWYSRITLYNALFKYYKNWIVSLLLPSLHSDNNRVVAQTIDALSIIHDNSIIEIIAPYLEHSNPRVVSSTICCLFKFKSYQHICYEKIDHMLMKGDDASIDAALFAIGKLKLKKYLGALFNISMGNISNISRLAKLAYAFTNLEEPKGYELFSAYFIKKYPDLYSEINHIKILLHYGQIDQNIRLRIIEFYLNCNGDPSQLIEIFNTSPLNFINEISFLKQIRLLDIEEMFQEKIQN